MMTILTGGFNHQVFFDKKNNKAGVILVSIGIHGLVQKNTTEDDQLVGVSRIGTIDSHIVLLFFLSMIMII